ncbi:hypothetical protein AYL99_09842 [Fonsecaea erecta]|uniref:Uncharacterized protein n=1 Tax=Fonsecaea erecta TaxID=1367422 RepID=A0A178Z7D3_9EURO|nr:hypothetical protein AYL99_09842 [Fonsecaea erecta]OAP55690.1 hypothetical protein AYL99_09842 [Fonsecaea erecta]
MTTLGTVSVDSLTAEYRAHTLVLTADGKVTGDVSHPRFYSLRSSGLVFELEAWYGPPIPHPTTRPYHVTASFNVQVPGDFVTIITANYPKGKQVPIVCEGQDDNGGQGTSPASPAVTALGPVSVGPIKNINAILNKPFQVPAHAIVPRLGEVSIKFPADFLTLTDARIEDTNIVWFFDPVKLGSTQVRVTTEFGIEPLQTTQIYDVHVYPPVQDGKAAPAAAVTTSNVK